LQTNFQKQAQFTIVLHANAASELTTKFENKFPSIKHGKHGLGENSRWSKN
jgi:hypothetical protein